MRRLLKKTKDRLVKYAGIIGVILRRLKTAANWAANNKAVVGLVGGTMIGGAIMGSTLNGKINNARAESEARDQANIELVSNLAEQQAAAADIIENINNQAASSADDLRALIIQLEAALNLRAAQLDAELQTSIQIARDNLEAEADRLDSDVLATNQDLQTTQQNITNNIAAVQAALEASDLTNKNQLILDITNLGNAVNNSIAALEVALLASIAATEATLQAQIDALPPIGSIAHVVDASIVDPAHYVPCAGATVLGYTFPASLVGVFIETGTPDGLIYQDTTAVNGLVVADDGEHSHSYQRTPINGFTKRGNGSNVARSGTFSTIQTGLAGLHNHALTGDAETKPDSIKLSCVVRYQ